MLAVLFFAALLAATAIMTAQPDSAYAQMFIFGGKGGAGSRSVIVAAPVPDSACAFGSATFPCDF